MSGIYTVNVLKFRTKYELIIFIDILDHNKFIIYYKTIEIRRINI